MTHETFDAEAWVAAAAPAVGLTIAPAWREQVVLHTKLLAAAAAQFTDFPLDIVHDEAAPVFRPEQP